MADRTTTTTSQESGEEAPVVYARAWQRVAAMLTERIHSGVYAAGESLPTERALAEDMHVHRRVVRAAIDELAREGLINQRPHCRPTVGPPAGGKAAETSARPSSRISASNLVALIMWHGGGPLEHAGTSQQRIFWGMNQALTQAGYHAVFLDIGDRLGGLIGTEDQNAAREAEHLRYVQDQGFGGVVFYPYAYQRNADLVREVSRSVPMVLLDRKMPGVDIDFVGIENRNALKGMTQHLLSQGHRRIAYITQYEPIHSVQDRIRGYLDAVRAANEHDIVEMVLTIPPYSDDRAWGVVEAVFRLPEGQRPTAAACFTDYAAVSLAEHLELLGLSVPRDIALTGFDDIVPALPSGMGLTTVAQPYEQIGSAAVELLLRRIKDPSASPVSRELPARLVLRESSAHQAAS